MLWISETALPCASAVTIAIVSPVAAGPAAGIEARREMRFAALGEPRRGPGSAKPAPRPRSVGQIAVAIFERELRRLDDDVHVSASASDRMSNPSKQASGSRARRSPASAAGSSLLSPPR
jgi:hypothetical protein